MRAKQTRTRCLKDSRTHSKGQTRPMQQVGRKKPQTSKSLSDFISRFRTVAFRLAGVLHSEEGNVRAILVCQPAVFTKTIQYNLKEILDRCEQLTAKTVSSQVNA